MRSPLITLPTVLLLMSSLTLSLAQPQPDQDQANTELSTARAFVHHHASGGKGRPGHARVAHQHHRNQHGHVDSPHSEQKQDLSDILLAALPVLDRHLLPTPLLHPHRTLYPRAGAPASTDTAGQAIYSSERAGLTVTEGQAESSSAAVSGDQTGLTTSPVVVSSTTDGVGAITGGTTTGVGETTSEVVVSTTTTAAGGVPTAITTSTAISSTPSTTSISSILTTSTSTPPTTTSSVVPSTITIQTTLSTSTATPLPSTTAPTISLVRTTSSSRASSATASSTNSAASANDATTSTSKGLSKTTIIILIVVGCALVAIAAGWTLFRKWKLKPRSRFDARLNPLDFSPSHDLPDPFMEKTRRGGAGVAATYGANRMSATSMTSISSADRQRRQFVNELDMDMDGEKQGGYGGDVNGRHHQQDQMRYGPMGYPPLMNDLPGHDFTAAPSASGPSYPPNEDGYANLRRAPSTAGTNMAGFGAGTRGLDAGPGVSPGGYHSDHGHGDGYGDGYDNGMEMMSGHGGHGGQQQYLDESFNTPEMGYGRPTAGPAGPYAAAAAGTHYGGNGARY